jgi:hypothetical protein
VQQGRAQNGQLLLQPRNGALLRRLRFRSRSCSRGTSGITRGGTACDAGGVNLVLGEGGRDSLADSVRSRVGGVRRRLSRRGYSGSGLGVCSRGGARSREGVERRTQVCLQLPHFGCALSGGGRGGGGSRGRSGGLLSLQLLLLQGLQLLLLLGGQSSRDSISHCLPETLLLQ